MREEHNAIPMSKVYLLMRKTKELSKKFVGEDLSSLRRRKELRAQAKILDRIVKLGIDRVLDEIDKQANDIRYLRDEKGVKNEDAN